MAIGSTAPVIVFAYNRRGHVEQMVASLLRNPEAARTKLRIYCDGARGLEDQTAVNDVRDYVSTLTGFASVDRIIRPTNLGLAPSIIDGVTRALTEHERVIVVEDDLVLSPHFLRYMNEALDVYSNDAAVASIHGYCYPTSEPLPETFFLKGADCWGWATWRRAWRHFNPDGAALLQQLRERGLTRRFDFDGAYPYTRMLEDQVRGRNSSWAIRWHASCFLSDRLTLYPGRSLVHNIGNDSSGTHAGSTGDLDQRVAMQPVRVDRLPLVESASARAAFVSFLRTRRRRQVLLQLGNLWGRRRK